MFLPSPANALKLKSLMESSSEIESVSVNLQRDDFTKFASLAFFQALLQNYPSLEHYLGDNEIVYLVEFEKALAAFQQGDSLTESKKSTAGECIQPK